MNLYPNKKNIVAAFDFDNTLTSQDTFLPFMKYVGGALKVAYGIMYALPYLPFGIVCPHSRQKAKEAILTKIIGGKQVNIIKQKGEKFIKESIPPLLKPEAINKLKWHQAQGHRCILVSATLDVYLETWAQSMDFQDLICSRLEILNHHFTGKLVGRNCWGKEKVNKLLDLLGPKSNFTLYAYGDSKGDKQLLELADYPFYCKF